MGHIFFASLHAWCSLLDARYYRFYLVEARYCFISINALELRSGTQLGHLVLSSFTFKICGVGEMLILGLIIPQS